MIKTTWTGIKNIKVVSDNDVFYSQEAEYRSNLPISDDRDRYYIRIQQGTEEYYTFISITDPRNTDQIDFEDNCKSTAIEI